VTGLRVLIVFPFARHILGGQEVEAALLMRKWQGDPDIEVSFLPSNPALPQWMRVCDRIPYIRTLLRLPVYLASLWPAISRVEVVHVFSASYTSFLLTCVPAWLISRLQRKAVVLNYHTARRWQTFADSSIVRFVLKRTERNVVPSRYLAAKFEEAGWKVDVIPNIIGDQFRFRARCNLQARILCARNLSPDYGIEVAINAFAIVQAQYPNASLSLVGEGPLRRSLEAQVSGLGLSGVTFRGAVPNENMPEWYDRADIFLNASFLDNAPLSILEAMTCGLPVVTTDAGGIPLMVKHGETGLVAPVGDAQTLAEHVIRLLREPEFAATLARHAYEQLETYRWPSVRPKWLELYRAAALNRLPSATGQ
jgi:glycosyltransferase involved in cell wall biosynthesis